MSDLRFDGRVAIVTGAGGNPSLGRAHALALAARGAQVVVNDIGRDPEDRHYKDSASAQAVAAEISSAGGLAVADTNSVATEDGAQRVVETAIREFGRVDILVNNAGIYEFLPLEKITEEHFHRQFNLNVLGLLLASQAAAKQFDGAGGSIINISSLVSTLAIPECAVYSGTKGAVDAITRSLASELGPRGIRVNAIRPGIVETEGTQAIGFTESEMRKQVEAQTPLRRIGQPKDIAGTAAFLASEDSAWITGETFVISGGFR